jgi:ribonuclease P protein component
MSFGCFLLFLQMTRISLDRPHALRGKKTLEWFFANRKWVRTARPTIIECGWAERPLPDDEAAIRFLILASKRSYKRAHDRNLVKRWLRAAVNATEDFSTIESSLAERSTQLLVMLRIAKPLASVKWPDIVSDMQSIAAHLAKRTSKETGA